MLRAESADIMIVEEQGQNATANGGSEQQPSESAEDNRRNPSQGCESEGVNEDLFLQSIAKVYKAQRRIEKALRVLINARNESRKMLLKTKKGKIHTIKHKKGLKDLQNEPSTSKNCKNSKEKSCSSSSSSSSSSDSSSSSSDSDVEFVKIVEENLTNPFHNRHCGRNWFPPCGISSYGPPHGNFHGIFPFEAFQGPLGMHHHGPPVGHHHGTPVGHHHGPPVGHHHGPPGRHHNGFPIWHNGPPGPHHGHKHGHHGRRSRDRSHSRSHSRRRSRGHSRGRSRGHSRGRSHGRSKDRSAPHNNDLQSIGANLARALTINE